MPLEVWSYSNEKLWNFFYYLEESATRKGILICFYYSLKSVNKKTKLKWRMHRSVLTQSEKQCILFLDEVEHATWEQQLLSLHIITRFLECMLRVYRFRC